MAGLLSGLRGSTNANDEARIAELLEAVDEEISEARQSVAPSVHDTEANGSSGERELGGLGYQDELDTESLDLLDEDLHINDRARATGFIGKNSEIQWLRAAALAHPERTDEEVSPFTRRESYAYGLGNEQISSYSFWTDSESVEVDFFVDPYDLPHLDAAERLLNCYMSKVHDSFPILPRRTFEDQFRKYFKALANGNAPRLSPKWQAILNLVFAIGARHSHLSTAKWQADGRDHLIYQARARAFGLNDTTMTTHSDVPQIQSLGLLAFYWLSVGQVSRAWTIIGVALRSAYSLGLHVRNEDPSATATKRETLVRTWWSLYSLERILSVITGRPSIIVDSCCSVPLPMPIIEEHISDQMDAVYRTRKPSTTSFMAAPHNWSNEPVDPLHAPVGLGTTDANSGSYFKAAVQLSIITHCILTSLYNPSTTIRSAVEIQQEMAHLNDRLDQWTLTLPQEFNFEIPVSNTSMSFSRERMILGFQLCSAKILLGRICLNPRRQAWREGHEATFARRMGNSCVEAARTVTDLLPKDPNSQFIYDQGPWWCIVHHLVQAASVFLLGLSYPSSTSHEPAVLMQYISKVIRWLQVLQDPVAARAYQIVVSTYETISRRHHLGMWKVDSVSAIDMSNVVDPGMSTFAPTRFVAPGGPSAFENMSAGTAFPAYSGTNMFADNYHMTR